MKLRRDPPLSVLAAPTDEEGRRISSAAKSWRELRIDRPELLGQDKISLKSTEKRGDMSPHYCRYYTVMWQLILGSINATWKIRMFFFLIFALIINCRLELTSTARKLICWRKTTYVITKYNITIFQLYRRI